MKVGIVGCGFVGSEGISTTLRPVLSPEEQKALVRSAEILQEAARGIGI